VVGGPSCEVLETEDGTLVPLVGDAIVSVDVGARRIEVDRAFLGLDPE
jgi:ribosomal 30S subunit maturation factor RimM